ncbi:hypothetical protein M9H77_17905 [Catharanthus roseus]|uniref:Uncharacterized protein n=1 Tax=Catharanthus roseus TaxID=4058 RepID=A0ACC0B5Y9_CATRO|nr:hypothetical protein M9H77_17905 [Catharanthus roseus]
MDMYNIDISPKVIATKGQWKTNSTKKNKSYWEHVSLAHRKIQKSSGSGSGSGSGSCGRGRSPRAPRDRGRGLSNGRSSLSSTIDPSPCLTFPYTNAFPGFMYPFIENKKNVNGDGNYGNRVVADFVSRDEHQWHEVYRRMIFELEHTTNMYPSLFGSAEQLQIRDGYPLSPLHVNGFITVVIKLAVGLSLILTGLKIGTRGMLEHIH